jgi:D-alanyl-D-alanine carboxypeptidase
MTSGIPSYTRNTAFQKLVYENIRTELTDKQLLQYAHPEKPIPQGTTGFDYSNTNYTLAGLIIEAITKHSFADELQKRLLDSPDNLNNTFYVAGSNWKATRAKIMPRMVHGYYYNDDTKKMVDATDSNLSWAGPAGGMVSDTQDIADWVNILYHGLAIPADKRTKSLQELETLVSMKTGKPITTVSKDDPKGFGLGIGSFYEKKDGRFWLYEGSGMGFRMMYIWKACNNVSVVAALNNKGGEGDTTVNGGDHIEELVVNMYDKIIAAHPDLKCKD